MINKRSKKLQNKKITYNIQINDKKKKHLKNYSIHSKQTVIRRGR